MKLTNAERGAMPKPTGFQHLVLLALFAGHSTVTDIVKVTGAFTEDVEFVLADNFEHTGGLPSTNDAHINSPGNLLRLTKGKAQNA